MAGPSQPVRSAAPPSPRRPYTMHDPTDFQPDVSDEDFDEFAGVAEALGGNSSSVEWNGTTPASSLAVYIGAILAAAALFSRSAAKAKRPAALQAERPDAAKPSIASPIKKANSMRDPASAPRFSAATRPGETAEERLSRRVSGRREAGRL